jgi:hypothetical protein
MTQRLGSSARRIGALFHDETFVLGFKKLQKIFNAPAIIPFTIIFREFDGPPFPHSGVWDVPIGSIYPLFGGFGVAIGCGGHVSSSLRAATIPPPNGRVDAD